MNIKETFSPSNSLFYTCCCFPSLSPIKPAHSPSFPSRQTSGRGKMPRKIHKSFHDYLPKFRINPTPNIQVFSSTHSLSASLSRVLSRCKYPKTPSFMVSGDRRSSKGATLSDIDRFLFENFRSLYPKFDDHDDTKKQEEGEEKEEEEDEEENPGGVVFESPRIMDPPSNINFSERFFSAPGFSSSLMEDARASLTASSEDFPSSYTATTPSVNLDRFSSSSNDKKESLLAPHECIAVLMNSPNPYLEFRMSMQEMIEARLQRNEKADWDFMEDLLFCYLNLNDKATHKHILQAFVDLINDFGGKTDPSFHDSSRWERMEKEIKKVNVKFQSSRLH